MAPPASIEHWKPGRSAYELAADGSRVTHRGRVTELLTLCPEFSGAQLTSAIAEKKTSFDEFSGPRNHDLLVHAECTTGPVTVGVEGKADEPFDLPIWAYREKALRDAHKRAGTTNAPERVDRLVKAWFRTTLRADKHVPPLVTLGYQLFSALAGTLADARVDGSVVAVVLVQEFRTNFTSDAEHDHNAQMLDDFLLRLIGPDQGRRTLSDGRGWITEPRVVSGAGDRMPASLPVSFGKLVRDLRWLEVADTRVSPSPQCSSNRCARRQRRDG